MSASEDPESLPTLLIQPRERDLGGFVVKGVLPYRQRRMVGPFIFFDHMGPADFGPGQGIDVRPHPHINLSTLTYLFDGEILHRDTLGYEQPIRPGAVNWMTAGRGIAHSERVSDSVRASGQHMEGIQAWLAMPDEAEETDPSFQHVPEGSLARIAGNGVEMTLIAGEAYGERSPVTVYSPLFYLDCCMTAGARLRLPEGYRETALYLVSGAVEIEGRALARGQMLVNADGAAAPTVTALQDSHMMLLGGEPLGERFIWWNFVSSRKDRIEQAKADWQAGTFGLVPGDTEEFIPLPES